MKLLAYPMARVLDLIAEGAGRSLDKLADTAYRVSEKAAAVGEEARWWAMASRQVP